MQSDHMPLPVNRRGPQRVRVRCSWSQFHNREGVLVRKADVGSEPGWMVALFGLEEFPLRFGEHHLDVIEAEGHVVAGE